MLKYLSEEWSNHIAKLNLTIPELWPLIYYNSKTLKRKELEKASEWISASENNCLTQGRDLLGRRRKEYKTWRTKTQHARPADET